MPFNYSVYDFYFAREIAQEKRNFLTIDDVYECSTHVVDFHRQHEENNTFMLEFHET